MSKPAQASQGQFVKTPATVRNNPLPPAPKSQIISVGAKIPGLPVANTVNK